MNRSIAIVGAPSSIGIRPYDTGEARHLDRAPDMLRQLGIVERLGGIDLGDVTPPAYRDYARPLGRARNEQEVLAFCMSLANRVAMAAAQERFVVLLGGDCSIVLGALLGTKRSVGGPVGLAYVDAHADFATPEESQTGSVASMCLGLAVGRGDTQLARIGGQDPLVCRNMSRFWVAAMRQNRPTVTRHSQRHRFWIFPTTLSWRAVLTRLPKPRSPEWRRQTCGDSGFTWMRTRSTRSRCRLWTHQSLEARCSTRLSGS
jgi:arginase family enzyme